MGGHAESHVRRRCSIPAKLTHLRTLHPGLREGAHGAGMAVLQRLWASGGRYGGGEDERGGRPLPVNFFCVRVREKIA